MKHPRLLEPAIVAALLLAHVPGLAEELQPLLTKPGSPTPAPISPAEPMVTQENPALGL